MLNYSETGITQPDIGLQSSNMYRVGDGRSGHMSDGQ